MNQAFSYQDIFLIPKYSTVKTRRTVDVTVNLGKGRFRLPVIPANMAACIDEKLAAELSKGGYFYVMHRFNYIDLFEFCEKAREERWLTISIAIGVQPSDYSLVRELVKTRCDYLTIDIAHGHSESMKLMLKHIYETYAAAKKDRPFIIAGNVATGEAVKALAAWGADAVKVGIGGGGACSTKNKTGFHVPMWSCVAECCQAAAECETHNEAQTAAVWDALETRADVEMPVDITPRRPVIIADGGVRENGDIAKALAAGAKMVMAGSIFAACKDSPAENVIRNDMKTGEQIIFAKKYYGSASAKNKRHNRNIEGFEIEIPCNGMFYFEKLHEIQQDLQSAVSYAGGNSLAALAAVEPLTTKGGTVTVVERDPFSIRYATNSKLQRRF